MTSVSGVAIGGRRDTNLPLCAATDQAVDSGTGTGTAPETGVNVRGTLLSLSHTARRHIS